MKKAKIEVFKAGRYGDTEGRIWSKEEVQALADNYDSDYRSAPVILGHNDWNGEKPAYGWVESLKTDDNGMLVADIEYNDELGVMVKDKKYTRVSIEATKKIELYDTIEGKTGAYVLAVALLGGSQPAVAGLRPVQFTAEDKINAESLENDIEAFTVNDDAGGDETSDDKKEHFEGDATMINDFDKKNTNDQSGDNSDTMTSEVGTDSTKKENKEYSLTQAEIDKFKADQKALRDKEEAFDQKDKDLREKQDAFALKVRKDSIKKFISENSKKIVPAVKEEVESFMLGLDEKQTESFEKIIAAYPEAEIFKNMADEKNENEHIDTDEKFQAQAEADIAAAKK